MAKTYLYLKWWQWLIVVFLVLNNLLTSPPATGGIGYLFGSAVGAYLLVAIIALLWRGFVGSDASGRNSDGEEEQDEGPSDEYEEWRREQESGESA